MTNFKSLKFSLFLLLYTCQGIVAQSTREGIVNISLTDLSAFKAPGKNWVIASDAHSDLLKPLVMEPVRGTGIVLSRYSDNNGTNLETSLEFGDLELEFDFMLARNTHAGVLLQGRYEINLNDSWAKTVPNFTDCGGIAEMGEESGGESHRGFNGLPPSMNVCRAPGLWQHLKVLFRAPHINEKAEKTANAKFEEVYLNGILIHEQVVLSAPSRNAVFNGEKAAAPLVFLSNSGAVAFTNISYRVIAPLIVAVSGLQYKYYKSDFKEPFPDLAKLNSSAQDTLSAVTANVGKGEEVYALDITGFLQLPAEDNYTMSLFTNGMGRVYIDGQLVIERITNKGNKRAYTNKTSLYAGKHHLRVIYVKNISDQKPALVLSIKGVNTDLVTLSDKASGPSRHYSDPIYLQPQGTPYLLRSFLNYGDKKLTHTISVGDPNQINYSYDLKQGALIQVWRGDFLEVTDMWLERGEPQIAVPRGSVITLSDAPAVAVLADGNTAWPDSVAFDDFQNKGYTLDDKRAPSFRYILEGLNVSDKISIGSDNASLVRQLNVSNPPANLYCQVALASKIDRVGEGTYRVGDKSYYITIGKQYKPVLRQTSKGSELIIPFQNTGGAINYTITW
jgi:hypothetical protein